MSELRINNREKYAGKTVKVMRDHEPGTSINTSENNYYINQAVYIQINDHGSYGYTAVHPDEARTIAAALIEAADEFDAAVEEAKPNGEDFVNALPIGARFRWENQFDDQYWIKTGKDEIYLHSSRGLNTVQALRAENFKIDNNLYVVED